LRQSPSWISIKKNLDGLEFTNSKF